MSELRKGDRVRVTFEAEYQSEYPPYHLLRAGRDGYTIVAPHDVAIIELIQPRLEDLRPGDVYRTADDLVAIYSHSSRLTGEAAWAVPANSTWWASDDEIKRPLTLLVRDGQVVT